MQIPGEERDDFRQVSQQTQYPPGKGCTDVCKDHQRWQHAKEMREEKGNKVISREVRVPGDAGPGGSL